MTSVTSDARPADPLEPIFAAVRAGDVVKARPLARAALARGVEHPLLLNLRALEHEEAGRFNDALNDLRRAHFLAPNDYSILNACGLCLGRLRRPEEAIACFDKALAIEPSFGPAWFNRAGALELIGEIAKADRSYARAAEIVPENAQAWANMAFLASRRGDAESAHRNADRALALQPGHPTAQLALAGVEPPELAEARLHALLGMKLTAVDRALALGILGDALDAKDRPAEAFAAYADSNALLRQENSARFEAPPTTADALGWLMAWADGLAPAPPPKAAAASAAGEKAHVFLMGFARSGTTLIESMLARHPDIVALEERETLRAAVSEFLGSPNDLARLATAPEGELRSLRQDYWARVRQYGGEPAGKIFIDKNPFNTVRLPLIAKLFPHAKILFAVRDPRDVVLSCFRRRFGVNSATYEFLDLRRTAANYAATMQLAVTLRAKLGFDEHRIVYERLVSDFETEAKAVCTFIGADWRPELADFAGRARRGEVASASAAQIARGLYSDGAGQWRRYKSELQPVMEALTPWVERFGYPAK